LFKEKILFKKKNLCLCRGSGKLLQLHRAKGALACQGKNLCLKKKIVQKKKPLSLPWQWQIVATASRERCACLSRVSQKSAQCKRNGTEVIYRISLKLNI